MWVLLLVLMFVVVGVVWNRLRAADDGVVPRPGRRRDAGGDNGARMSATAGVYADGSGGGDAGCGDGGGADAGGGGGGCD